MEITQCLHTAILVSDLAKAEQFYTHFLGLTKVNRTLNFPGVWYQVGNVQIHLMVNPDFTAPQHNSEKWGRNPHLALKVANLEQAIAKAQSQGYPIQMSASGRATFFIHDPDGNVLEISQI